MKCILCERNAVKRGYCNSCYTILLHKGIIKRKYVQDIVITDLQREFITGSLLGDGWITNLKYGRKSPSFVIDRKQDDLEYLQWQYAFVNNLCLRPILLKDKLNKTTQKIQKHCLFETRYLPSLLEFRKLWYPNDRKVIPQNLKLTKLIMQIWYCDDGSIEINSPTSFRIKFSTHGFLLNDILFLINLLEERYGSGFSYVKDGKNKNGKNIYYIRANHTASIKILKDIQNNFPSGMKRKFNESLILKIVHNKKSEKLTEEIVRYLRKNFALISNGKTKFINDMSQKYNVSPKTIGNVIYRITWKNL